MKDTDVVVGISLEFKCSHGDSSTFSPTVPIIAPRLGGMAEKIQHEYNGCLFDPDPLLVWKSRCAGLLGSLRFIVDERT